MYPQRNQIDPNYRSVSFARQRMTDFVMEGDRDAFLRELHLFLGFGGRQVQAELAGVSLRTFQRIMRPDANPRMDNLFAILRWIASLERRNPSRFEKPERIET